MPENIHACISIIPKYSVANEVEVLEAKSTIRLHREFRAMRMSKHVLIRVYDISTMGLDEEQIRRYIREQGKFDRHRGIRTEMDL